MFMNYVTLLTNAVYSIHHLQSMGYLLYLVRAWWAHYILDILIDNRAVTHRIYSVVFIN